MARPASLLSALLPLPLFPLVEIVINLLRFHPNLQATIVSAELTVGPVVSTDLTLTVAKDAPETISDSWVTEEKKYVD